MQAGARDDVIGYPVQPAKVQRPPLRDETLARDRLLDWLNVKIHHRVVVITAEAGYGKTTLLADFSRRTRHRTLWYRLDEEDRNWVAFLSYLVAAGREHDPGFAPATFNLLRETGATGASPDSVIETFVREFQTLGDLGAVLILDDYHVVDDAPDVRQIMGQLLARAPERVTFVFSTRRRPSIKVARLRGRGEVAELTTDDLRFSDSETERLFRDTYQRPLEPDVLDDLSRRTEGWAASLQLVQAAIRDRTASQIRTFVRNLSGAEGDLYDYFAEEVVGDLDEPLQDFLMKTSILETVEPEPAEVTTGATSAEVKGHINSAETLGLLSKRSDGSRQVRRFHPLVREFLHDRLAKSIGHEGVRELHRKIADWANANGDWRMACDHLAAMGDVEALQAVLADAVQEIMGSGQYLIADSFLERYAPKSDHPTFDIVRSRVAFARGRLDDSLGLARRAVEAGPGTDEARTNLISINYSTGNVAEAVKLAEGLAETAHDPLQRQMARALVAASRASIDGDLLEASNLFEVVADELAAEGREHQQGIALLNAAEMQRGIGDPESVIRFASSALELLSDSAVQGEAGTAHLHRAWAYAHRNDWAKVEAEIASIAKFRIPSVRSECELLAAEINVLYGDIAEAERLLSSAQGRAFAIPDQAIGWLLVSAAAALRQGEATRADSLLDGVDPSGFSGAAARRLSFLTTRLTSALERGAATAKQFEEARSLAERQGSTFYARQLELLEAFTKDDGVWDRSLGRLLGDDPAYATIQATLVSKRLHDLSDQTLALLEAEARRRPVPWRTSLRLEINRPGSPSRRSAAGLLDVVGSEDDIPTLRAVSRALRGANKFGKNLARSLAPRVTVEDLGRVHVQAGDRMINGTSVRRKVLACLVFLASRPSFAATRDQVLDALWPDLAPEVAVNSLNQTIYFLRRVFEPDYKEDLSPEYVHHDSDVLWLDQQLVNARSAMCWSLLRRLQSPATPADVAALCDLYTGRFALDFAYEEWAVAYRDALHAAFLQVVETAVAEDMRSGHFDRGVATARRALEIDSEAEQIELSLLRLYRRSGAYAAAAEQYAHYSAMLRSELGVEPPPLDSL